MGAMNYRLIIFDADGTLRRCTVPGQPCPNRPGEWELIPGVRECLARLDWGQTCVAIASNQAGVALGYLTAQDAIDMLHATGQAAFGAWLPGGIATAHVRICPHRPADGCQCRKPAPGMVLDIMAHYRVAPAETLYVGDMDSDRECAARAGVDFRWAADFFGWDEQRGTP